MGDMFLLERALLRKKLRPHQEEAISLIGASARMGNRRIVCQMPTGAGKTVTASHLIERSLGKGKRVIFTAPAISLIDQTVEAFEGQGIQHIGVMQASHPRKDPDAPVQIASVQTLARRDIPEASLVIVDECHLRAEVVERMMEERQDVFFVGLSATPWAKGMGLRWQDLVVPCRIGDLIDAGLLSKFTAFAPDVPDLSGVKVVAGDYVEQALADIMGERKVLGSVVRTWLDKGGNRPTLCFAVNRDHAKQLAKEFEAHGVSTGYVDAMTDRIERARLGRQFRSGEIKVICSVRTMTTGVDLPVSCIVDAAPTKSEMLHVQKIGRGLRVNEGTEDCLILDHAGNSLRLGLVTDIHHDKLDATKPGEREKREPKAERLPKPCPSCDTLFSGPVCSSCGHERRPSRIEEAEGELVELRGKKAAPTPAEKQVFWSALLTVCETRGRSRGWAAHAYREKMGVWPRGLNDVSGPCGADVWNWVKAKDIRFAKSRGSAA